MSADGSTKKTVIVALAVALVCSVFVSAAAVGLSKIQEKNKKLDRITNILQAGEIDYKNQDPAEVFNKNVKSIVIDLKTGEPLNIEKLPEELKPDNFNVKEISKNPDYTKSLSQGDDIAGIKLKPDYMIVYEVMDGDKVDKLILPIFGYGLWSTMYGFIALDSDLMTVKGITFYEHGETPGLGGEIDNTRWKATWKGKQAFNTEGEVVIKVIKGLVDRNSETANRQIDGLSGATITTRGLDNTIKFWLGESGYKPFLDKIRKEKKNDKEV